MNARDEGTEEGTDAMEMKNTLAFQRFVGMIWRRVRPPYWHSCGDADELACHRAPPAGIPEALAAALADGVIPDVVPASAGPEAHLKGWVRREMALLTAGVGTKHREKFNP